MSVTNNLNDPWEAGETVLFSGTISNLPSGADPTDYTVTFKIKVDGTLKDTIDPVALNASSQYAVSHTLDAALTGNSDATIYMYLVWDTTKRNYLGSFEKRIYESNYS